MHHLTAVVLCAIVLSGCGDWNRLPKPDAIVASGRGLAVTASEFTARLEEQPPFVRAGYATLERKKELLDSMVRFEVLAREAERLGLDRDPEVVQAQQKVMVQKLVQSRLQTSGPVITEAELVRYYEAHQGEFISLGEEGPRPLTEVRAQIENKLQRDARARALETWVTSLKERAAVSVDERALGAIPLPAP